MKNTKEKGSANSAPKPITAESIIISPLAIKAMHAVNRPEVIQKLYSRDKLQLINELIVERDAKNQAYYFILENGHFDAFCTYCKNPRKENCN